jgi:hypothetical protein
MFATEGRASDSVAVSAGEFQKEPRQVRRLAAAPARSPVPPAARAARRSQSCAIGRPKGSICTCTAGPVRRSPPPSPRRHAGRGCEPAGPSARPIADGVGARGRQTGGRQAPRVPLGHAGGVPTIRVTRPQHREPARARHLLRPRSCRGWHQADRRPSAVSDRITTWPGPDCGGGRRAEQRNRKDHEHGGPQAAPAAAGRQPGSLMAWPAAGTGLARCPRRIRGEPVDDAGAGPLDAAASLSTGAVGRGGRSTWSWRRCLRAGRRADRAVPEM